VRYIRMELFPLIRNFFFSIRYHQEEQDREQHLKQSIPQKFQPANHINTPSTTSSPTTMATTYAAYYNLNQSGAEADSRRQSSHSNASATPSRKEKIMALLIPHIVALTPTKAPHVDRAADSELSTTERRRSSLFAPPRGGR